MRRCIELRRLQGLRGLYLVGRSVQKARECRWEGLISKSFAPLQRHLRYGVEALNIDRRLSIFVSRYALASCI